MKTVRESDFPADGYDHAQICPTGHVITGSYYTSPEFGEDFCAKCGKPTISACPSCEAPIRGHYKSSMAINYNRPPFCIRCGAPFPWTARGLEEWRMLTGIFEGLSDTERARLEASIDDLVSDTPGTGRAVLTIKTLLPKVGKEAYEAARTVLVAIASAKAKSDLGL
jgi:hypothetical protein